MNFCRHKTLVAVVFSGVFLSLTAMASETEFACVSPVQSFSKLERMKSGDFTASVKWKDVALTPNSIGYGPGEDHRYELTILDGRVYMARPGEKDSVIVRNDPKPNEGAAMLQIASPKAWAVKGKLSTISSFDDLNFELDLLIDDLGCNDDVLLPFKIKGHASSVTWSMDTHPSRITTTKDQNVDIIGLYNRTSKQRYFMVRGYNIHPHVVMRESGYAGHLRSIELDKGAKIYLPVN